MRNYLLFIILSLITILPGCKKTDDSNPDCLPKICVSNTYLAAATSELTDSHAEVFSLAEPGMCPGHFDISPDKVKAIADSQLVIRFNFQGGLDEQIKRTERPIVAIAGRKGLVKPETFLAICQEIIPHLSENLDIAPTIYDKQITQLETRLNQTAVEIKEQIKQSNLTGAKVLASHHQADFCQWLGLEVVGTFKAVDIMTPADIETVLKAGRENQTTIIIANAQEGTELAQRIADELNAHLVVFSNFPAGTRPGNFEKLLRNNVKHLTTAQ